MQNDQGGNKQNSITDNQPQNNSGTVAFDGGSSSAGVTTGFGNDGYQNTRKSDDYPQQTKGALFGKIVSLKGTQTKSEMKKREELEKLKEQALKLQKKLSLKEKKITAEKKNALRITDNQSNTASAIIDNNETQRQTVKGDNYYGDTNEKKTVDQHIHQWLDSQVAPVELPNKSINSQTPVKLQKKETQKTTPISTDIRQNNRQANIQSRSELISGNLKVNKQEKNLSKDRRQQGVVNKDNIKKSTIQVAPQMIFEPDGSVTTLKTSLSDKNNKQNQKLSIKQTIVNNKKTELLLKKKHLVDLSLALQEKLSTHQGVAAKTDKEYTWKQSKVNLTDLSPEERINLQATPMLASIHFKMEDDTNGDLAKWIKESDKLPVDIKLGLRAKDVTEAVLAFAYKYGLLNEGSVGEISRIVREVYSQLLKKKDIRQRFVKILKIPNIKMEESLRDFAKIVVLVQRAGKKQREKIYELLSIHEALKKYPKIAAQEITTGNIKSATDDEYINPTVENWLNDYINNVGSGAHDSLIRGRYLSKSNNVKILDNKDKECLDNILKSYDENTKLVIDPENQVIMCYLHTNDDFLKPNKNKRIINNFTIKEAQTIDIDDFEKNKKQGIMTREDENGGSHQEKNKSNLVAKKIKNDTRKKIKEILNNPPKTNNNKTQVGNNETNYHRPVNKDNLTENVLELSTELENKK